MILIFDLDGTLIDSVADIADSVNVLLKAKKLAPISYPVIKSFIGDGAKILLTRSFRYRKAEPPEDVSELFQKVYFKTCVSKTYLYPGVISLLKSLKNTTNIIFSNKPQIFCDKILKYYKIRKYFSLVIGHVDGYPAKPDSKYFFDQCKKNNISFKNSEVMVIGDSIIDLQFAKNIKSQSCIVTYGYGNYQDVLKLNPDFFIKKIEYLKFLI